MQEQVANTFKGFLVHLDLTDKDGKMVVDEHRALQTKVAEMKTHMHKFKKLVQLDPAKTNFMAACDWLGKSRSLVLLRFDILRMMEGTESWQETQERFAQFSNEGGTIFWSRAVLQGYC